jgi:hypothetical protein
MIIVIESMDQVQIGVFFSISRITTNLNLFGLNVGQSIQMVQVEIVLLSDLMKDRMRMEHGRRLGNGKHTTLIRIFESNCETVFMLE